MQPSEHPRQNRKHGQRPSDQARAAAHAARGGGNRALAVSAHAGAGRARRGGRSSDGVDGRRTGGELRLGDARPASVNPNGSDTSYYFQYGLDQGLRRADGDRRRRSRHATRQSEPRRSAGLQPLTVYHYRLVAVNSAGASDRRRSDPADDQGAALAGDPGVAQPGSLWRDGDRPGHALGHRQRQPRGRPAGNRSRSRPAFQNVGNPELDERHRRLLLPGARHDAGRRSSGS